ncbi:MAG: alginate export family protein [Steroidobacteraceae bacterium]
MNILVLLPLLTALAAAADGLPAPLAGGKAGLELRYRHEYVEQPDKPSTATANTLRLRLNLRSGSVGGISAFAELDHVLVVGAERYDSTRNGRVEYPVVADPEGTDLNQLYLQYAGKAGTILRIGRQRMRLDSERFIGAVGWRQNEQTYDAVMLETTALPGFTASYAYIDEVRRPFGPDPGSPQHAFASDSHILNLKLTRLPVGVLTAYGYFLDFSDAPQLSSGTHGLRYDGSHAFGGELKLGWALEYARQRDGSRNPANIDADYSLIELGLGNQAAGVTIGREALSGERGTFTASMNPAFQTPLATLHKWQGWADKFLTTPSAGIEDIYIGLRGSLAGWNGQIVWHDFQAQATGLHYGTELDISVSRKFAGRYEVLAKHADYSASRLSTDTRKFWLQLAASF